MAPAYAAVVLTGGRSRRLAGVDKTALTLAGRTIRQRVLDAVTDARLVVVSGPTVGTAPPTSQSTPRIVTVREEPAGGGPLAGLAAAVPRLSEELVVVLAGDLPFAAGLPAVVAAELARRPGVDAAVPLDETGRPQPLAAAYRLGPLRSALGRLAPTAGRPVRALLAELTVHQVPSNRLPDGALVDVDTPDDWARARTRAAGEAS